MSVVSDELKAKRVELAAEAQSLAAQVVELQAQVAAVDSVIRIYEPDWMPEKAAPKRRGRPPKTEAALELESIFGKTNKRQMTLEILRMAGQPMSTADCAQAFAAKHGLASDDPRMGTIANRLSSVLDALHKAGRVRHAGTVDGRRHQWEIAA